jgi:HAD superfamily hydrolase (TIGR01549 family)
MGKFGAVIFDIDGTVWDIFPVYHQAVKEGLKSHGIPPPNLDDLIGTLKTGESFREKLTHIAGSLPPDLLVDDLIVEIRDIFNNLEEQMVKLYPGAIHLFSELKNKNIKIGLFTGRISRREKIRKICRRMGIDHLVDAVTSQLYIQNRKPAPDLIIDCTGLLEVPVEKCLVVGDTKDDILAARNAGTRAIGILSGIDNYEEMMAVKPLAVVKSLEDILAFV